MHIEMRKEACVKSLEIASRITTKHLSLPILQCVLVRAGGGTISFASTNLELGVTMPVEGTIQKEGVIAVPGALLLQTVNLLTDTAVTFMVEDSVLVVKTKNSKTTITTFPIDEFPQIPVLSGKEHKIDGALFALGIRTVAFATSQSSIKPELGSVFIEQQKEHTLTFVATDSFRLMEKTVPQKQVALDAPLLIPQKNALEMARILDVLGGNPELVVGEGQAALRFSEGAYVMTRLTEGSFPDYKQIIPKEFSTHATVLTGDLAHALKMTGVFSNTFLQVIFDIHKSKNRIVISSDSGGAGGTVEEVSATIDGADLKLSFNQRYVSDPLPFIVGESVTLHFAGVGRPLVMEGVNEKTMRYLVMPMNK